MLDYDPQTRTYCKTASQLLNDTPIDSGNVRIGSLAALRTNTSSMSAFGGKAAVCQAPTPREVDSPGSLRPMAAGAEPIAVLEVPLIAA
jgi:hypothetical protein